jgi:hypothetical protein
MSRKRNKPKNDGDHEKVEPASTDQESKEASITITSKPIDFEGAKEVKADKSLINQPAPKKGISLVGSWGPNKRRK